MCKGCGKAVFWQWAIQRPAVNKFVETIKGLVASLENCVDFHHLLRKLSTKLSTSNFIDPPLFEQKFYSVSTAPIITKTNFKIRKVLI